MGWVGQAAIGVLGVTGAQANPVADFYTGKNVNVLIGYSAGGGYDLYARLLSRHMGKHIPGRPGMVAQNMPGAGSLKVATFLYSVAPKDGTAIGTFGRGMPIYPLLFTPEFDGTKFGYLGSITKDTSVCITWHTSPIKNWNDLMTKPSAFGGEGKGNITGGFGRSLRAPLVSPFVSQRLAMLVSKEHYADLLPLTELIDAGQLTPSIDATYPLDEAAAAMRRLEAGTIRGKVCLPVQ